MFINSSIKIYSSKEFSNLLFWEIGGFFEELNLTNSLFILDVFI